jgi:hypothetical protein
MKAEEKVVDRVISAKEKLEIQEKLNKFREETFGDQYLEVFRENLPKKQTIHAKMTPEEELREL